MAAAGKTSPLQSTPTRVWVLLGAAGLCLALFVATIAWVFEGENVVTEAAADFDRSISLAMAHFRDSGGPTGRMVEISALGSAPVLGIFAIVVYSLIIRSRDWVGLAHLTTVLLGASLLSRLLQHVWDRARPETLLSYISVTKGSFPSAHLFGAAACYATFAFFYARYAQSSASRTTDIVAQALAALLVVLIGSTRVYLGAHHTTDVVAGIAGGWAFGLLVAALFSLWYPDRITPAGARR